MKFLPCTVLFKSVLLLSVLVIEDDNFALSIFWNVPSCFAEFPSNSFQTHPYFRCLFFKHGSRLSLGSCLRDREDQQFS